MSIKLSDPQAAALSSARKDGKALAHPNTVQALVDAGLAKYVPYKPNVVIATAAGLAVLEQHEAPR